MTFSADQIYYIQIFSGDSKDDKYEKFQNPV